MYRKTNQNFSKVVFIMTIISVAMSTFFSCQRQDNQQQSTADYLIKWPTESKELSNTYMLSTHIGHDGKNCPGCILDKGVLIHRDCIGYGHYCRALAQVILDTVSSDITATTTDTFGLTSNDFFLMPNRSLNYTDENNNRVYLNIPEQLVYRDSATQQFTFTGLFFTDNPEYTNE